jgi:hypothetical protein
VVRACAVCHFEKVFAAAFASFLSMAFRKLLIKTSFPSASFAVNDDEGRASLRIHFAVADAFPSAPAIVEDTGKVSGTMSTLERASAGTDVTLLEVPGERTRTACEDVPPANPTRRPPAFLICDSDAGRGIE